MWIEIPDGYEFAFGEIDQARYVMLLLKAMYLVQAPCAFYKTFRKILTSADIGILQSKVDLCLFYKQNGSGRLMALMVIRVDDCAIAGKKSTVEEIKKAIE